MKQIKQIGVIAVNFLIVKWFLGEFSHFAQEDIGIYALNIAVLINLISNLGKSFAFIEFIAFSAITFWLTMPLIMWELEVDKFLHPNMFGADVLAVPRDEYYAYALPATLAMVFGLYIVNPSKLEMTELLSRLRHYLNSNIRPDVPKKLFIIGAFAYVMGPILPTALRFLFYLVSQFVFIAVLYCMFGDYSYKRMIYIGTLCLTVISITSTGMFGMLVWWGLVIAMYYMLNTNWGFVKKVALISLAVVSISFLQSVKIGYRAMMWGEDKVNISGIKALSTVSYRVLTSKQKNSSSNALKLAVFRANQAHLSSLVLENVPKREPYARGETIFGSLLGSFVPRIIWPNKPKAGGHENIRRFGGYEPHGNTAMDIGQIGDAWANFGHRGGIIFLFIYGLTNALLLRKLISNAIKKNLSILLWMPIVFLMLLKVETSVVTTFNAAIKGLFFIFLTFWVSKQLNYKI